MSIMSQFRMEISNKINEFKRMHRRNLSIKIRKELSLDYLQIARSQMKKTNDIELFHTCQTLIARIQDFQKRQNKPHNGLDSFIHDMQGTLDNYVVYKKEILHVHSYGNKHLLNILQHLSVTQDKVNNRSLVAIKESGTALIEFGHQEFTDKLLEIMQNSESQSRYVQQLALYFTNLKKAYDIDPLKV